MARARGGRSVEPLDDPDLADWVRAEYAIAPSAERRLELIAWVQSLLVARGNRARKAAGLQPLLADDDVAHATVRSDSIGFEWFYVADLCSDIRLHHRVTRPLDDEQVQRMLWALQRLHADRRAGKARRSQVRQFAERERARPAAEKHDKWREWADEAWRDPVHAYKSSTAIAMLIRRKHKITEAVRTIRAQLAKRSERRKLAR